MGYSIKNCETGELEYFYTDTVRVKRPAYDEETGEPIHDQIMKVHFRKHTNFHVPKHFLRGTMCDEMDDVLANTVRHGAATAFPHKAPKKATPGYEREDYCRMDGVSSNIILGYNRNQYLLFLVPTLFCFNFVIGATLAIIEIFLHMMSHHKNSLTMQNGLYFRSPLHVLSSQFCAICRTECDSKYNRIFDILNKQMRNAHRSEALKDMAKAIG
ncbi:uncharacterized protein LOC108034879 isoform X1 [Drosophila biarmipes]|uniref:uncharacterized protein LOC108034879 isoform X1 n=1 Tax=Drosophila biarmipes TaxID=125945 RepID=UPI0007E6454D|nr:uncharacterized protein LOC108034879 isoform X1 [Drosophila biarmipes]